MALFSAVRRQLLRAERSSADEWTPEWTDEEGVPSDDQAQTSSKLGALLVLLVPFAIAAWVAIGLSIYRLLT
jgi:hypothetical protein